VVLITIGSSTVRGAYVTYEQGRAPTVPFSTHQVIEPHADESTGDAMLRTLEAMGTELIERGAPALRRATGSSHVHSVLISMAGSWQETHVRSESVNPGKEFVFTRKMLGELLAGSAKIPEGRVSLGDYVVATMLNGYHVPNPINKRAKRAEVVILSSTLDAAITEAVRKRVRKLYHTHAISFVAFLPTAYAVLRDLYPHEKDFLMLDVSSVGAGLAFVKSGLLVDVGHLPLGLDSLLIATRAAERMTVEEEAGGTLIPAHLTGTQPGYINPERNARFSVRAAEARDQWLKGLADILKEFAKLHALPRTLFLLTEPNARDFLKRALDSDILHALWLSDEPLTVITVVPEQFSSRITYLGEAEPSIFLDILALYQQRLISS
jgi:hypothetical protein